MEDAILVGVRNMPLKHHRFPTPWLLSDLSHHEHMGLLQMKPKGEWSYRSVPDVVTRKELCSGGEQRLRTLEEQ